MNDDHLDVELGVKKEGLSLKDKGAGLLVLISFSIIGIIVLSLKMADSGDDSHLMWPIMTLAFITYNLIALTAAVLGFTFRDD